MCLPRKLAVLDAPCSPEFRGPPGEHALRQRDLARRMGARDAGWVEAGDVAVGAEPAGRGRRGEGIRRFTEALAGRVRELVGAREFPVVLGGHCHVLLGNMLGLRSLGRYGLVFVDGQDDFSYVHDRERHRGFFAASGLDLALVTGNGPDELSNLHGLRPYVDERHVVLFGMYRDPGDDMLATLPRGGAPCGGAGENVIAEPPGGLGADFRLERIRAIGAHAAAEQARRFLEAEPLAGFWIHVDADVLDRAEDGDPSGCSRLEFEELTDALRVLLCSERAAGIELTIDDPELDPDGVHGDRLMDSVVRALAPHG